MKVAELAAAEERASAAGGGSDLVRELRALALAGLPRMYYGSARRMFAFRVRPADGRIVQEGTSPRYSAISLIGLATERPADTAAALGGDDPKALCAALVPQVAAGTNLGDMALTLWAAALWKVERGALRRRMGEARPAVAAQPAVEVAWALSALCMDDGADDDLRAALARRLAASLSPAAIFPHVLPAAEGGLRDHVACFADMVYPIQALSLFHLRTGDGPSLATALRAGEHLCRMQGPAGQWWWHYDRRTGDVLEGYPVYAIHQDAMGPMALFALQEASGRDFTATIVRSLAWLKSSPELGGGSLVDRKAGLIWRKVARREPGKLARYVHALTSRVHPRLRVPGIGHILPPRAIDYEDRPYHLGWLLHAWPPQRAAAWPEDGGRS